MEEEYSEEGRRAQDEVDDDDAVDDEGDKPQGVGRIQSFHGCKKKAQSNDANPQTTQLLNANLDDNASSISTKKPSPPSC